MANNEETEYGVWVIYGEPPDETANPVEKDDSDQGCVYIYYYPIFKEMAELKNEDKWQCIIGSSQRSADIRVGEQITGMPQEPVTEIILQTDDPQTWEKGVHFLMKISETHVKDAPGQEWFMTSPNDVKKVVEKLKALISELKA